MQNYRLANGLLLAVVLGSASITWADETAKTVPELSLESLYHPDKKFDFDGSLPETRWIGQADSRLLVQRDSQWMEFDFGTGSESPWPIADRISERIAQLGGLEEEQVRKATSSAVKSMKRIGDATVVKIDKSLAIVTADAPARWLTRDASTWGNTTIDPIGRRVGYTQDGDLFLVDVLSGQTHRLTTDGADTILDGVLDWTYQEEIFGRGNYKGFWFSADANWLAMLRVDIGAIEPYVLSSASADRGRGIVRRYPKAGDPIPHASLWVWDLRGIDAGHLPPPKKVAESTPSEQRIITGVWWCPSRNSLVFSISDRVQSWRELRMLDESFFTGEINQTNLLLREESSTWVEPPDDPAWLDDGSLVWRSELPTGRNRLYHIDISGKVVTPYSPEDFHVVDFAVSLDGMVAVVTGNAQPDTVNQQVYRINTDEPSKLIQITRGTDWHSASISPDANWIVDRVTSAIHPPNLILQSVNGAQSHIIAESKLRIQQPMTAPLEPRIETDDGVVLPAMMFRPTAASPQHPCPVVIEVYGGPQSRSVSGRWAGTRALYRELLCRRGVATLVLDNRSSAARGSVDSWPIHRRVGEVEFQDLMVGVHWLREQPWVDSKRLAIRGWSFGGFLTLYAMTHTRIVCGRYRRRFRDGLERVRCFLHRAIHGATDRKSGRI